MQRYTRIACEQASIGRASPRLELVQIEVAEEAWGGGACGRSFYTAVSRHPLGTRFQYNL